MWLGKLCSAHPVWSSGQPVNKVTDKGERSSSMWKIRKNFLEEVPFKLRIGGKDLDT